MRFSRSSEPLLIVLGLALSSCSSDSAGQDAGGADAAVVVDAAGADAAGLDATSTDAMAPDATVMDAVVMDAGPMMSSGMDCDFNRDCPAAERCECDEAAGCQCLIGPRGTGQAGVDACASGEDCASSVCLEGPNDDLVCSGPCDDESDCGGVLPLCADIAFVGRICIRDPNG